MTHRHARCCAAAFLMLSAAATPAHAQQRIALPAADRPLRAETTPIYRAGAADGAEWETFGNIFSAAFDSRGNLYVLDTGSQRVIVFDTAGRHVRSFGRHGGGPGELQAPIAIAVDRDGNVVINDAGRSALQVLKPTGEYLRSVPLDGMTASGRMSANPQGGVITQTQVVPTAGSEEEIMQGRSRSIAWLASDVPARPLYSAPPQTLHQQRISTGQSDIIATAPAALSALLHWGMLPDGGIVATHTEEYRLTIVGRDGSPQRIIERPLAPRRVTEQDRRRHAEQQASSRPVIVVHDRNAAGPAQGRGTPPAPGTTVFAERIQVVQGLAVDADGRIWVRRGDRENAAPVDVIGSDGRYLGTIPDVRLPVAFGPNGVAAWIETDDLGVQRIAVRRVALAGR
jgi:hypothetical protein